MPKAILEFNLPEDLSEYNLANNASNYYCAIDDIKNYLRKIRKYDERDLIPKQELLDAIYLILEDLPD